MGETEQILESFKQYRAKVLEDYPDALDRVTKYHTDFAADTLFQANDAEGLADEVQAVYCAAEQLGYERVSIDDEITTLAVVLQPGVLDTLAERLNDDDLVD